MAKNHKAAVMIPPLHPTMKKSNKAAHAKPRKACDQFWASVPATMAFGVNQ